ncbi:MAG: hypothetical protein QOE93_481, partial [Actinomycetota bacterium]|nr:hypothetical protein [Actinomycetota bacterium]
RRPHETGILGHEGDSSQLHDPPADSVAKALEDHRHIYTSCAAAIVPFVPSTRSFCDDRQGPANTWTNLSSTPEHRTPIVKKPLAALLLAAASVAAMAVPAGAAVPKGLADLTFPCNDGSGKSAQVWTSILAAKNPCRSAYLTFWFGHAPEGESSGQAVNVAPGAHFNKGRPLGGVYNIALGNFQCGYDGTWLVAPAGHGKWQPSLGPKNDPC